MSQKTDSSPASGRITRLAPPVRVRMFGFVLVVLCGGVLLLWSIRKVWSQLEVLQKEHAAVKSETFYLGVTLRSGIRSLNDKLLEFGISRDPALADAFFRESTELAKWMEINGAQLADPANQRLIRSTGQPTDQELLQRIEKSYHAYLSETGRVVAPGRPPPELDTFEEVHAKLQAASQELLALCDELVAVQGRGFSEFLAEVQRTLLEHQRLLKLTWVLLLVLAVTLAVMIYRGMIAPLRRKLTQSKTIIERQEKLASLGVLASGVAHEIRNPLTAIKFRLFSLNKTVPALSKNEDAGIIADEINRLERIVRDFLRFARPSEPELAPMGAANTLEEVRALLYSQLNEAGIQLRVDAQTEASVLADSQQVKQVLINLIQNAAEAIGRDGVITVGVRQGTAQFNGTPQPAVILYVADTGKGISPAIEARLFDPFFTTKEKGTGLGLAVAARIVEKHGGVLRYETEMNQGTTFEIVLPQLQHDPGEITADRG